MDFELSQEQVMLKDSVERFVQENYEFTQRKALAETVQGYSDVNWATFAEMGWLALPFAEENGGFGGSAVDMAVIAEALGAGITLEPLVPTVLLGGGLVEALGDDSQKQAILPQVAGGEMKLAAAIHEPGAGFDLTHVNTTAERSGDGWVLNGHKAVVQHAATADRLVVLARISGGVSDRDGISAFLIDANASGLRRQDYPMVDASRASDIWLENVSGELLGGEGDALPVVETVVDTAICAICAEAVGAMQRVLEITKDYTATRNQFGKALSDNQVIQHRLVDMYTAVEESKAITDITTMRLDDGVESISAQVSAMKAKVGEAARFVGAEGVQLHGGIGMTDEYPIGHYFKRLMAIDVMFGDHNHHLNRFAGAK